MSRLPQTLLPRMYNVFKQLANGGFVYVESCGTLEQAVQLVEGLKGTWPGNYVVRDAGGTDVRRFESPLI